MPSDRQAFKLENKVYTFSTRSMKKSLTSFVLVNFAAMLTSPLERFFKKTRCKIYIVTSFFFGCQFATSYIRDVFN